MLKVLPFNIRSKATCKPLLLLFDIIQEVLATTVVQKKKEKKTYKRNGENKQSSLFLNDVIFMQKSLNQQVNI